MRHYEPKNEKLYFFKILICINQTKENTKETKDVPQTIQQGDGKESQLSEIMCHKIKNNVI